MLWTPGNVRREPVRPRLQRNALNVGLVACLPLNEGLGSTRDLASGNVGTLTVSNGWPAWDATGGIKFHRAAFSVGFVTFGNRPAYQVTGPLTMSVGVYRTGIVYVGQNAGIVTKNVGDTGNNRSYQVLVGDAFEVKFSISSDGTAVTQKTAVTGNGLITSNTLHRIVARFIPSTSMDIFVDGVLKVSDTTSVPAGIFNGTAPLRLGMTYTATGSHVLGWEGYMDMPYIWSRALSDSEILRHSAYPYEGLVNPHWGAVSAPAGVTQVRYGTDLLSSGIGGHQSQMLGGLLAA